MNFAAKKHNYSFLYNDRLIKSCPSPERRTSSVNYKLLKAFSRSALRSSMFSMPTDNLIRS